MSNGKRLHIWRNCSRLLLEKEQVLRVFFPLS